MNICFDCGQVFADNECYKFKEDYGATSLYCPSCHSSHFGDSEICDVCGQYVDIDDLHNGICEFCIYEQKNNYELLKKISEDDYDDIKLPSLITSSLDEKEISDILFQYIEQNNIDCTKYIENDIDWFADKMREVIG